MEIENWTDVVLLIVWIPLSIYLIYRIGKSASAAVYTFKSWKSSPISPSVFSFIPYFILSIILVIIFCLSIDATAKSEIIEKIVWCFLAIFPFILDRIWKRHMFKSAQSIAFYLHRFKSKSSVEEYFKCVISNEIYTMLRKIIDKWSNAYLDKEVDWRDRTTWYYKILRDYPSGIASLIILYIEFESILFKDHKDHALNEHDGSVIDFMLAILNKLNQTGRLKTEFYDLHKKWLERIRVTEIWESRPPTTLYSAVKPQS